MSSSSLSASQGENGAQAAAAAPPAGYDAKLLDDFTRYVAKNDGVLKGVEKFSERIDDYLTKHVPSKPEPGDENTNEITTDSVRTLYDVGIRRKLKKAGLSPLEVFADFEKTLLSVHALLERDSQWPTTSKKFEVGVQYTHSVLRLLHLLEMQYVDVVNLEADDDDDDEDGEEEEGDENDDDDESGAGSFIVPDSAPMARSGPHRGQPRYEYEEDYYEQDYYMPHPGMMGHHYGRQYPPPMPMPRGYAPHHRGSSSNGNGHGHHVPMMGRSSSTSSSSIRPSLHHHNNPTPARRPSAPAPSASADRHARLKELERAASGQKKRQKKVVVESSESSSDDDDPEEAQ